MNEKKEQTILQLRHNLGMVTIFFLCLALIGSTIAAAVNIRTAAGVLENETKNLFGTEAKFHVDQIAYEDDLNMRESESFLEDGPGWPDGPTLEEMRKIGELPEVEYYDYSISAYLTSSTLKTWSKEKTRTPSRETPNNIELIGIGIPEIFDVTQEKASVIEGRAFSEEELTEGKNVVILSKQIAMLNDIQVGSKMTLDNKIEVHKPMPLIVNVDEEENELKDENVPPEILGEQKVTLEVVGILDVLLEDENPDDLYDNIPWQNEERVNKIYVPNKVAEKEVQFELDLLAENEENFSEAIQNRYDATYYLKSVDDVASFKQEANKLLPRYYTVYAESDKYEEIAQSIIQMEIIARWIIYGGVILSLVILSVFLMLWVHARRGAILELELLGKTKVNLIARMIGELFLIALVALMCASFVGNKISNSMEESVVETVITQENEYFSYEAVGDDPTTITVLESFDASATMKSTTSFFVIEILTLSVAMLPAVIYILRLKK